MAITNRTTLKTYFQTGDTPTQGNFGDLIDSLLSIEAADTGLTAISSLGGVSKVVVIDTDHNMYYTTVADIISYINANDTTDNLREGTTNLYFTNGRARAVVSASGAGIAYNSTTGVFTWSATTDNVSEGTTNQYFTNARARAAINAGTGLSYNGSTGVFSLSTTTDGISEGSTNKYFTNARAQAAISATGNELNFNNSTGVISKNKAIQTITYASGFTFNVANGYNAQITLTGNATLSFSNASAGEYYSLKVIQDSTGSRTLTLPGTCKVVSSGGGAVTLSVGANLVDILCFYYDGTNYFVTIGTNFN